MSCSSNRRKTGGRRPLWPPTCGWSLPCEDTLEDTCVQVPFSPADSGRQAPADFSHSRDPSPHSLPRNASRHPTCLGSTSGLTLEPPHGMYSEPCQPRGSLGRLGRIQPSALVCRHRAVMDGERYGNIPVALAFLYSAWSKSWTPSLLTMNGPEHCCNGICRGI